MYIVMNVLGLPFNGDTLKTKSLGGSETAGYYVARELARRGHKVTLFTASKDEGVFDDVRYVWAGEQTPREPLGERFHFYALRTQHDVCIVQRHPGAFAYRWASKINLLWLHDLATYRSAGAINNCLWNVDGVLPVSEWHGKQVAEVWGVDPSVIYPVRNGVDLSLYNDRLFNALQTEDGAGSLPKILADDGKFKLLYAARPERGLENLVKPDGIMARLAKISPDYHLYFCGYDNTRDESRVYYEQLWRWAEERGNCTNLGALTKQELADIERQCDLYVYPTTFEDTSCIMAMECAAAGLPFLASEVGALPETCKDTGSELVPLKDGQVDIPTFVQRIKSARIAAGLGGLKDLQMAAAPRFSWVHAVDAFELAIQQIFDKTKGDRMAVLKHFEHVSDIYALKKYAEHPFNVTETERTYLARINELYAFAEGAQVNQQKHYEDFYATQKQPGPEDLTGNHRFESVYNLVARLPAGSVVLDYGCAHGHYTINLARRLPQLRFIGVDIAESNIATAREWLDDEKLTNVRFYLGSVEGNRIRGVSEELLAKASVDCVIAAEVLEHVANPTELTDILCSYLKPDGLFLATTPYGPWEAESFTEHYPYRFHLWHFERGDLRDLFGMHPKFNVVSAFNGLSKRGEVLGSYITTFKKPARPSGEIDYARKFAAVAPRQTVALCTIVKDGADSVRKMLTSCASYVDEVVIGLDEMTTDETRQIIVDFLSPYERRGELTFNIIDIPSPLKIGFDEARNLVLKQVTSQWVFWPDADEELVHADDLYKYLRNNQYGGYAMALRHFTMEPPGLLRTDLPTKLFRANIGAKFYGCVHEHPEIALNKGLGHVTTANDVELSHFAYVTEAVRRARFERNFELMKRDRRKYPERLLGKYLWVRDLAQLCRWTLERNGGVVTPPIEAKAREGLALWQDIVKDGNVRLIMDGLQFYSELNSILGEGFEYGCLMDTSKANGGLKMDKRQPILGRFSNVEEAQQVTELLLHERTKVYDSRYF